MDKITEDWNLYEEGIKYNNQLYRQNEIDYYDEMDAVEAFFSGDQWRNVEGDDLPKPVFNYIKRALTFFVASLTSSNTTINFEAVEHSNNPEENAQDEAMVEMLNTEIDNILEKMKFENRLRDLLFNAGKTGDACMHFYFDSEEEEYRVKGRIKSEIIDGANVMFGNANNYKVEEQPYIIITGRDIAKNLQEEARLYREDVNISDDKEYQYMTGDNGEVEVESDKYGKALYIIVYRKKKVTEEVTREDGTVEKVTKTKVFASKGVKGDYIYQDIDTGLSCYPLCWMNWEKEKNSYHGKGMVIEMIPNQIAINKMFAMVIYHLMLTAFPTAIYDADKISSWTNQIGAQIPVTNMQTGDSIRNMAGYLEPAQMSNQIIIGLDNLIKYTKECIGITDVNMGSIDPKNTSAIIAVQKSSVVPLENIKSNMYEFIEDMGKILMDMIGTKYGLRKVLTKDGETRTLEEFDFSILKDKWLNVKADVGNTAYYSEIASMQTLDNLLNAGQIDIVEYLERIPDYMIPRKAELIDEIQKRLGMQSADEEMAQRQQYEAMAQYFETLPSEIQDELNRLTDAEKEQAVMEMMAKDIPQDNTEEVAMQDMIMSEVQNG